MPDRPRILAIGEVLWDCFPDGRRLGGAPFNFAYYAAALGADVALVTAVGTDALGDEILALARPEAGFELAAARGWAEREGAWPLPCVLHVRRDPKHPTGKVRVRVDAHGVPTFDILKRRAWDFIEWDRDVEALAEEADLVYFGTLAQRSPTTQQTIREAMLNSGGFRLCDLNLRPPFVDIGCIRFSLLACHALKLNEAELAVVGQMFDLPRRPVRAARWLLRHVGVQLVCVTCGARGCLLVTERECVRAPAPKVTVVDTVGAGDAFAASLAVDYLLERDLKTIAANANHLGALVASHPGAIVPRSELNIADRCAAEVPPSPFAGEAEGEGEGEGD